MVTKHEVLQAHLTQWLACKGSREKRGALTQQLSKTLSIHKKSVGRSMRRLQLKDTSIQKRRGRNVYYGKDVDAALFQIWEELDYSCAENIPNLDCSSVI